MGNPTPSSGAHHPIAAVPHPFPAVSASGALPSKVEADTGGADRKERPETGEAARFEARRARLIRCGWALDEAQAMAERLARRDLANCTECASYRHDFAASSTASLTTAVIERRLSAGCMAT